MQRVLLFLSILIITTACSNFHMEKRRYNKGFHVSFNKNRAKSSTTAKEEKSLAKADKLKEARKKESKNNAEILIANLDSTSETVASEIEKASIEPTITETSTLTTISEVKDATQHVSETSAVSIKSSGDVSKSTEKNRTSGLWYFTLLGLLPMMLALKRQSHQLGTWAAENTSKARLAITGLYTLGAASSFLIGDIWQPIIEEWMLAIPLTIAGSVFVADAVKKNRKQGFIRKRMAYAAVNASSFFATFALGVHSKLNIVQIANPDTQTGLESHVAVILTVALVAIMSLAIFGLAALACNLACSGYGVLAVLVLAAGSALVLFFGTWAILGAIRGRARSRDNIKAALIAATIVALLMLLPLLVGALI